MKSFCCSEMKKVNSQSRLKDEQHFEIFIHSLLLSSSSSFSSPSFIQLLKAIQPNTGHAAEDRAKERYDFWMG